MQKENYQRTDLEEIRFIFDQVRPVVSHLEIYLTKKPPTPKNIGEALGSPQRNSGEKFFFVQYEKNKNIKLLSDLIPIKYLPEGTKVLRSIVATIIKES